MNKTLLFSALLIVIPGCSNPYSQFYTDYTEGMNVLENPRFIISTGEPRLVQGSNIDQDEQRMLEDGYILLGISSFNVAKINQSKAIEHAKKIHADTVIVYSQYTDTRSGSMPLTVPDTQTTYHSGSIGGLGGGFATYSGSSTTYGTKTTYMPYSVQRYDYLATFWIKAKPYRLGIYFEDLTPELRKSIESNKGTYIAVVVKDSPAFNADLLTDDIIRKFNDVEVINKDHFANLLGKYANPTVRLEILREGKTILKEITLTAQ